MDYPTGFPDDLLPDEHSTYHSHRPGTAVGDILIETDLGRLREARRDYPGFPWPLREDDDVLTQAALYRALWPHLPGRTRADVPLPPRGDLDGLAYAAVLHTLGELVDLVGHHYASANELFGSHFPAAVSLPEVFTGARTARALSMIGGESMDDLIDPEVEKRFDEAYDSIQFPARHPGESLTELLVRLWREVDPAIDSSEDRRQAIQSRLALIETAGPDVVRSVLERHWDRIRFAA